MDVFKYCFGFSRNSFWDFDADKEKNCESSIVYFLAIICAKYNILLTDLIHFPKQFNQLDYAGQFVLLIQYVILVLVGIISFVMAVRLFEKILPKTKDKTAHNLIIILTNYLIIFGVALGRVERLNSWDIFTAPQMVFKSSAALLDSPLTLLAIFLFGSFANLIYFALKKSVKVPRKIAGF